MHFTNHRLNQYCYVVGGFDGTRQLDSVERYDTENQTWEIVAPIKIARSALSLTVLDGKLWAMGGFDGHSFLNIVELYDPAVNKWEESTPLSSGRSGHASAVIYQPACVNQYMDCVDDQTNRGKKSPDDDDSKPGPSGSGGGGGGSTAPKVPTPSTSSSGHLHAFSGNRCTHCDDENKTESEEDHIKHKKIKRHGQNACSKYEQQCHEAIHCLLRMDEQKQRIGQNQCDSMEIGSENILDAVVEKGLPAVENDEAVEMEISDEETNDYDSFNAHDVRKYRRKASLSCGDSGDGELSETSNSMSENSSSLDVWNSKNAVPGMRNRLKVRGSEQQGGACSLSRLKNKVRQNICDFVNWSVSEKPKVIPQDTNSNRLTSIPNTSSNNNNNTNNTLSEERKCDLLRKYYKSKLKH